MRLNNTERQAILGAIGARDPAAEVYLFGSRTHDDAKGGDIDLLVLSGLIGFSGKLDIQVELCKRLGDRKIDMVVASDLSRPFTRIAISTGIRL
ncbi:MAG: nucleotidyltransferase domain-containing protein [Rhodocyclaceae bacterium]|nr:nucleotidyltransferase domain-containing protein [Rhodocyclaceae bacterium]